MTADPIVQALIVKFQRRSSIGQVKYGKTLTREDVSHLAWLRHLQEELMDAALYLERLIHDETRHHDDGK